MVDVAQNPFVPNPSHPLASTEANGVSESPTAPQPLLARGDSCDSSQAAEIQRKAAKRRKSLGRGEDCARTLYSELVFRLCGAAGWFSLGADFSVPCRRVIQGHA